jgi:hypothetical protein
VKGDEHHHAHPSYFDEQKEYRVLTISGEWRAIIEANMGQSNLKIV